MNPTPERKEKPIEQDLNIVRSVNVSKVTSEADFLNAYTKGLQEKNVGLYDKDICIGKDGNAFVIGKKTGTGNDVEEYISIANKDLLIRFIEDTTGHYNRDLFNSVSNNFEADILTKQETTVNSGVPSQKTVETIVITEELVDLENEVTYQYVKDLCKALTTGGRLTNPKGEKKYFPNGYTQDILDLIKKSKDAKDDTLYNKNLEIVKQFITELTDKVIIIKKQAKDIKNNADKHNHPKMLNARKQELDYIYSQLSQMENYIANPRAKEEPFNAKLYNIDMPIYSSKDIQELQKKIGAQDSELRAIDEGMFNSALLKLDAADRQGFRLYLNDVLSGTNKNPSANKYVPKNPENFAEIMSQYPALQGYINFYVDQSKYKPEVQNNTVNVNGKEIDLDDPAFQRQIENDPKYADRKQALRNGGLAGLAKFLLDKTKMTDMQKQTVGGVAQIALTVGVVVIGWKMLKGAFNLVMGTHKGDDEKNITARRKDRAWLLGPAAVTAALRAGTGEGIGAIFTGGKGSKWFTDLISGDKSKNTPKQTKEQQELAKVFGDQYIEGPANTIAIFNGMSYGELKGLIKDDGGKMKLKPESRTELMKKFAGEPPYKPEDKNKSGYDFLDAIGENDPDGIVDLSLRNIGIQFSDIQDDNRATNRVSDKYATYAARVGSIPIFMEQHGYSRINPDRMDKIKEYLSDSDATIADLDDLEKDGVFIKEAIVDMTGQNLGEKVEKLTGVTAEQKQGIIIGLNEFYKYMPTGKKEIDIIGTEPKIRFKTYGNETEIDLSDKTLTNFTPTGFGSYFELFKVANLTNWIKVVSKDLETAATTTPDTGPFKVDALGDIVFDIPGRFKLNRNILEAGRFDKSLKSISPTLDGTKLYKEKYCTYLNNITPKFWKTAPAVV